MITQPLPSADTDFKSNLLFGDWLVQQGYLEEPQVRKALDDQSRNGGRVGQALVRLKIFDSLQMIQLLAEYLNLDYLSLEEMADIDKTIARAVPENIAKRFLMLAVRQDGDRVLVAMSDPLNVIAIDTVAVKLKKPIRVMLSSEEQVLRAIEYVYHGTDVEEQQLRDLVEFEVSADDDILEEIHHSESAGSADADDAPVIRFVDLMLSQAVKSRASDIHIEPQERNMTIRMRIDGILTEMLPPPRKMQSAVIARLKILSEMDIAERRVPQDGRFKIKRGSGSKEAIDVRVSVLPTIYGEKVVMRILDKSAIDHRLDSLGLEESMLGQFRSVLKQPHGIIIVTGPTGSGKSTTLYSALNELRDPQKNITTVEDPVEYRQSGINQTQIKPEIGLTFSTCLRSILRQDPDIILIGEIRDKETMEIAIKASLTGHLVLSTFHTNDAPSAISRLVYMGLEPYLLASSLNMVLAQRLVRKICDKCKVPAEVPEQLLTRLKISPEQAASATFYHGKGCTECGGSGYRGRLPIFEFLVMDPEIRDAISTGAREFQIRQAARQKGYGGLLESGAIRVLDGRTTAEEVLRVTYAENLGE
jgi:type IV pilus assembly protein PilB